VDLAADGLAEGVPLHYPRYDLLDHGFLYALRGSPLIILSRG
jgi:hypothetical protein